MEDPPEFTLNFGVRYQPTTDPVGVRHPVTALPDAPFGTGFVPVKKAFAQNPSYNNRDPRTGFSYSPFKDNKIVIRGGFGMFHDVIVARAYVTAYVLSPPYTLGLQTAPPYPAGFSGGGAALPPSEFEAIDYRTKNTPHMMQYNFNIQRDLGGKNHPDSRVCGVARGSLVCDARPECAAAGDRCEWRGWRACLQSAD